MNHYHYECFSCQSQFSRHEIENNLLYICPKCGKAEKNKPLIGVLKIIYDYLSIRKKISKKDFLNFPPGKFWLYPQLWPLEYSTKGESIVFKGITEPQLLSIKTTSSPLFKAKYNDVDLLIFDDTRNPTLSFKDRASGLVALKAIQLSETYPEIAVADQLQAIIRKLTKRTNEDSQ